MSPFVVTPIVLLIAFAMFLAYCAWQVWFTGSTAGLRDFAEAIRAFWRRGPFQ